MSLDNLDFRFGSQEGITDPIQIFDKLTLRGDISSLWDSQGNALRQWHGAARQKKDVVIQMNTGGGKTLVGLLIAQSLVNETLGKVLYVCPTNQLVEQTQALAEQCGMLYATYQGGHWIGERHYLEASGPCITNYAAVFNSKSKFRESRPAAIVFDDAHVAHSAIRGQFTIAIPDTHETYSKILALFSPYFAASHQQTALNEITDGRPTTVLYVPFFEVIDKANQLRAILNVTSVTDPRETTFSWDHLKDHLHCCTVMLSAKKIEIAPPVLPTRSLSFFEEKLRRVYLTATIPSDIEFIRTFGVSHVHEIKPAGKQGAAQRLLIFPEGETDEAQREVAKKIAGTKKACVIVPSTSSAIGWQDFAAVYDKGGGQARLREFCEAAEESSKRIVLIARFDGVDLPGKACRILILDRVPRGAFLFERFMDQSLRVDRIRKSHINTRLVQAMGRIFRSNTDHGVLVVCGRQLQEWILDPDNRAYFPALLQQQIGFSTSLSDNIKKGNTTAEELIEAVLAGHKDWDAIYTKNVPSVPVRNLPETDSELFTAIMLEREAFEMVWNSNYDGAAAKFNEAALVGCKQDANLGAWYAHLQGMAFQLAKKNVLAASCYGRAANQRGELGRFHVDAEIEETSSNPVTLAQADKIRQLWQTDSGKTFGELLRHAQDHLNYEAKPAVFEEALASIGRLLGLSYARPDKIDGTGPDVLWVCDDAKELVGLEAKNGKQSDSCYKKDDIGQFHDHIEYVTKHYPEHQFKKAIVGRKLDVVDQSNPPQDLHVIPAEEFVGLCERIQQASKAIPGMGKTPGLTKEIAKILVVQGLSWPHCIDGLKSYRAIDLQPKVQMDFAE